MNLKSLVLALLLTMLGCKKENKQENKEEPASSFDKQALLVNLADQVILPNYLSFQKNLKSLSTAWDNYSLSAMVNELDSVRIKFNLTYHSYQRISPFELGPAEQVLVRNNFNVFPADTVQIKNNVSSGNYDLNTVSQFDAKGLPALDYLFYGNQLNSGEIHTHFQASANRRKYVKDVLSDMTQKIDQVIAGWVAYRGTFVNSLGTDISSSIGFLINQLNFELDYIKNAKVGIPLGKKTLGIILPGSCEAFYSERSLEYVKESVKALETIYLGRSTSGDNQLGFDDYLDHLKVKHNGSTLNAAIQAQFSLVFSKLNSIATPLAQQIVSAPGNVEAAYAELVKLLVLLKTDMPSSLGVVITYQDGDGD